MRAPPSELRATVDVDYVAGNPPRLIRGEKGDDPTDVVRLCDAFEGLHTNRRLAPRLGFRNIRYVRVDHTGSYAVDANALGTERRCKMFPLPLP
jgi:hypothetical protein